MAKVEITKEQTVCDRPGCGKRVTDKGCVMVLDGPTNDLLFVASLDVTPNTPRIDLCRDCAQQMGNAWNRKAGDDDAAKA